MRRALLFVLAATVIVVAGWSAIVATSAPTPLIAPVVAVADAVGDPMGVGVAVHDDAVVPVAVRAVAPATRLLISRDSALTFVGLVVLAAAAAVAAALQRPRPSRAESRGAPPRRGPALCVAPHRGPPAGLARPSGT